MSFQPLPPSNDLVESNFIDLAVNFNLNREQVYRLVTAGFSLDEMRNYQRAVHSFDTQPSVPKSLLSHSFH